jgi:hypothetical protein
MRAGVAAGLLALASVSSGPASADCLEDIGCTDSDRFDLDDLVDLSCQNLWYVRNRIYDENGFCFQTARARRQFDNSDCWVRSQSQVRLSHIERYNIDRILEAETVNDCN